MATIKTAISIDEELFRDAEEIGRDMKLSRSRLFAAALKDFIQRRRSQSLLEKINAACAETPPQEVERQYLQQMRRKHRNLVERW